MMDEKGKILLLAFELGARILSENSNKKRKRSGQIVRSFFTFAGLQI